MPLKVTSSTLHKELLSTMYLSKYEAYGSLITVKIEKIRTPKIRTEIV